MTSFDIMCLLDSISCDPMCTETMVISSEMKAFQIKVGKVFFCLFSTFSLVHCLVNGYVLGGIGKICTRL